MEEFPTQTNTPPPRPRSRRWPLGALTLIVAVFVIGGVLLFSDDDTSTTTTTAPEIGGSFPTLTGEVAPDFSVDLLDGTAFRLSDHLENDGRPVILNLWASWCAPCREEMPALDAASKEHTGVYFLGVAVEDDPAAAEQFADEIAVSYALAIDDAERVGRRYPSPGLPATFFISSEGRVVRTVYGAVDEAEIAELIAETFGL